MGLYYRYYSPEVGRFLNADMFISTGQGVLGNNMFAYCGNNPIMYIDTQGTDYTSGQIHNFVVEDICKNNPYKEGKLTYMIYKQPYLKGKKYHLYGYCDVFDVETHGIWEVKRIGGGSSCSPVAAGKQLGNYVANGILNHYAPWDQHTGGTYTTIEANTFHKRDCDGRGVYVISYWDTGTGIIYYDYYYLPAAEEFEVILNASTNAMGAGMVALMLCICLNACSKYNKDC